ncbi:MAG: Ig-like domain repeat protein [Chloroflexi bacterium]|nr:Ig-like domain repeat protein [Chloroflexota bacterium]
MTATFQQDIYGNPMPTGTVTFKEGATTLGTGTLNGSGVATLNNLKLPLGAHTITAEYGGDAGYVPRSTSTAYTVNKSDTNVVVTATDNPVGIGQTYSLRAKVNVVAPGGGIPTGTVTFGYLSGGTVNFGTAPVGGDGTAVLLNPILNIGTYDIVASYAGDTNYNADAAAGSNLFLQVSPTAPPINVNAQGPYTVAEGGSVTLNGTGSTGSDPTGSTLIYRWYRDAEGGPFLGQTKSVNFSAASISGPAQVIVVLKVCNATETVCATKSTTVTISNVAPTATLYAPTSANRGSSFVLSLGKPVDPGAGDLAKLEYSFDCGDGASFGAYSAKATATCNVLPNSSTGNRTVRGRLRNTDSIGQVSTYQATVTIRPWTVRFRDNFEGGLSTNVWGSQSTRFPGTTPAWTTLKCYQDTLSANPKVGKGCNEPYPTNYSTWMITEQKIDLTGGTDAALTFRLAWNLGSADLVRVYVATDYDKLTGGQVFVNPIPSSWSPQSGAEGSWRSFEVNLSQFKGQFVYLGFYFSSANDGTQAEGVFLDDVEVAVQEAPATAYGIGASTWYFAEGYTGPGFDEYLTIQNPNDKVAEVRITYYLTGANPVPRTKTVQPNSRVTIVVYGDSEGVGRNNGKGWAVSAKVESTNGTGIVVERPMYFTFNGSAGPVTGGHNVMGVQQPRTKWYFAEGWTGLGFEEFLTLMNDSAQPALVKITYFRTDAPEVAKDITVPARSRKTVNVHETAEGVGRNQAVSALVESTNGVGVVVERPMYFTYGNGLNITGGHNVMGASEPRTTWYFPTGDTRTGWHTYLTMVNPTNQDAQVKLTYYVVNEGTKDVLYTVPANRRETVKVHEADKGVGPGKRVGIKVASTNGVPLIVERPMYFRYDAAINGGHDVMGAPGPAGTWLFAEGFTGPGFFEELVILNPNASSAQVTITYQLGAGPPRAPVQLTVPANSRTTTVLVHEATFGVGRGGDGKGLAVSARVSTTHAGGVVVERPMYFQYNPAISGGHTVMGFIP